VRAEDDERRPPREGAFDPVMRPRRDRGQERAPVRAGTGRWRIDAGEAFSETRCGVLSAEAVRIVVHHAGQPVTPDLAGLGRGLGLARNADGPGELGHRGHQHMS
jgi:hypothetical protein